MDVTQLASLPPQGLAVFLLVLVRASAIFLVAPVLGNSTTPARIKVGLSLLLALIFTPMLMNKPLPVDVMTLPGMLAAVFHELVLGFLIGFLAQLIFVAMEFAGQVVGIQMGLSMATMFDPTTHAQVAVTSQFYLLVGVLTFMLLDGHHWVLLALDRSYTTIPLGTFALNAKALFTVLNASNELFWVALTLMAPVLGVLALTEVAMAIVARIMPQMNIFVASFPVKIWLGVATMALSFPLVVEYMGSLTEKSFAMLMQFLSS